MHHGHEHKIGLLSQKVITQIKAHNCQLIEFKWSQLSPINSALPQVNINQPNIEKPQEISQLKYGINGHNSLAK